MTCCWMDGIQSLNWIEYTFDEDTFLIKGSTLGEQGLKSEDLRVIREGEGEGNEIVVNHRQKGRKLSNIEEDVDVL